MTAIESIIQLNKIFKDKNWNSKDFDSSVFENFCRLLDNLNESQRELIIDLTKRYHWVPREDYRDNLLSVLNSVPILNLKNIKKIYFFPIVREEDEKKVKSGHTLLYDVKTYKNSLSNYRNIEFNIKNIFHDLKDLKIKDDELLFLIDDFIGSGETLEQCITYIKTKMELDVSKTYIISIATQKEIFEKIKNEGYSFFSNYICKKGISDNFTDDDLLTRKTCMLEIEKMIPGGRHFSFGYNASEALLTLARTPDNTFPIFWKEHKKNKIKYKAPFSRSELTE